MSNNTQVLSALPEPVESSEAIDNLDNLPIGSISEVETITSTRIVPRTIKPTGSVRTPPELFESSPEFNPELSPETSELKEKIQDAMELVTKKEDIKEIMRSLRLRKGLNEKFHTLLFQEIESDTKVNNRWDFVNKMSVLAKDFDVATRLRIERAAGELLGLCFEKV